MAIQRIDGDNDVAQPLAVPLPNLRVISAPPLPRSQWRTTYRATVATADFIVAGAGGFYLSLPTGSASAILLGASAGILFMLCIGFSRGYSSANAGGRTYEYVAVARASALWALLLVAVAFVFESSLPSVVLIPTLAAVALGALSIRFCARYVLSRGRRRGSFVRSAIVVGDYSRAERLASHLSTIRHNDINVLGACPSGSPSQGSLPILGHLSETLNALEETNAEVVIVTGDCMSATELRSFSWSLEPYDVDLFVAPNLEEISPVRLNLHSLSGTPLLGVALHPNRTRRILKGVMDRIVGSLLLVAVSAPLLFLLIAVRATSPGPAIFAQERIGIDGKPFKMYKLRSMYVDAEERRLSLLEHSNGNGVMFKMHHDPRITSIGKHLRRLSLDELPQLFNVVKGDMSLVGPRPPLTEELDGYSSVAFRRLKVKPGLTGLWQVSGRSELDWDETVRLDLNYVENWSLRMDLSILARTFNAVIGGRGAY